MKRKPTQMVRSRIPEQQAKLALAGAAGNGRTTPRTGGTLTQFLLASPQHATTLDVERPPDEPRDLVLGRWDPSRPRRNFPTPP
jgi:hypothetical protein